jgi:SAM-dependent methyltransferase
MLSATPMPLGRTIRQLASRIFRSNAGGDAMAAPTTTPAGSLADASATRPDVMESWRLPDAVSTASLSERERLAWENRDVPNAGRSSDLVETVADETQDVATTINFPLHWTSATLSWNYLFDFSVACQLLAPRPDDLVLDYAAGACWASELLSRLGVRTVSIDLSIEMLRRGRQRLASDSRLVFAHQAGFVAARGQALPFASETFDSVLCMNALHHLPSYAEALREIHRVLKPGGRAVFSEPGTAHAEQPLSQFRMREEGILEKNVSLPAVRRLAMDAGFSRMRVIPLRSPANYAFDYAASPDDGELLDRMWEDTLKHGPREHARFVLHKRHKGDEPPADTHLPAERLAGRLRAQIAAERVPESVPAGAAFTATLRVTNTGSVVWRATGRRFGGQVTCGLKVVNARGEIIREDLGRTPLPRDVAPGDEVALNVTVGGELPAGTCELRYDMVVEGVTWFELQGSPTLRRMVTITG